MKRGQGEGRQEEVGLVWNAGQASTLLLSRSALPGAEAGSGVMSLHAHKKLLRGGRGRLGGGRGGGQAHPAVGQHIVVAAAAGVEGGRALRRGEGGAQPPVDEGAGGGAQGVRHHYWLKLCCWRI